MLSVRKNNSKPARKRRFLAETLEERILYSATPTVAVQAPAQAQLGEAAQVTVSFSNSGTSTGYGPFVLVAIDHTGADGVAPGTPAANQYDGFSLASAPTYLGSTLNYQVLTLDDTANGGKGVINPYAKDSSGNSVYIKTTDTFLNGQYQNGDQILAIQLPFGSYTPGQPAADISFSLSLSNLADVGTALPLRVVGGFQFGSDALDNPTVDPSIIGTATGASTTVDATLAQISMTYNGPESETATGPNYVRTYRVNVDVANGQTLSGLNVFAGLPDDAQYIGISGASQAYSIISAPSTTAPGGTLQIQFNSAVTGTASTSDAWVDIQFYVPRVDGASTSVLNPSSGNSVLLDAQAYGYGNWTPVDTRDSVVRVGLNATVDSNTANPANPVPTVAPEYNDLEAQSIAVQKTFVNLTQGGSDANAIKPGDVLEFTLNFQVSDYYAFSNVNINDLLSDGLHIDSSFTPTLTINGNTFTLSTTSFASGNYTVTQNYTGATSSGNYVIGSTSGGSAVPLGSTGILFDISGQMISSNAHSTALSNNGYLLGGGVDPSNPTGSIANTLTGYNDGATTGTIVYRVVVQDTFTDQYPSGEKSLNPRDKLTNSATITGNVLTLAPGFAATGGHPTDDTGNTLTIQTDQVTKSIYAVNGILRLNDPTNEASGINPTFAANFIDVNGNVNLKPGDVVTYRIQYTLPTGDVEQLRFTDYLPLPIYNATEVSTFNGAITGTGSSGVPAAGTASFGPSYSLNNASTFSSSTVTLTTSASDNSIGFVIGTTTNTVNTALTVDILFSVTVVNQPFADGLYLTNLVQSGEQNTQNPGVQYEATTNAIVRIVLNEPQVNIYKGVVASDKNGGSTVTSGAETVTFNGTAGAGFTGTLSSAGNAANIGGLNLTSGTLPDAGDKVRFAIVVQNTGRSDAYDVQFQDVITSSYNNNYASASALQTATNLQVYRGDGTLLTAGSDYTLSWDNTSKTFSVHLTDNYTSGNSTGDTGNGGLSRGTKAADSSAVTDGSNTVIVLFDLTLATVAQANSVVKNTATLTQYKNSTSGSNFVPQGLTDTATVDIGTPSLTKTLTGTSIIDTNNSNTQAVIGEYVTYTLTITLPEGTTASASLVDSLAAGMSFVDIQSVSYSSGVSSTNTITTGATPTNVVVGNVNSGAANKVTFDFGTITNTNTVDGTAETITIVYRAVVLDTNTVPSSPGNQIGTSLGNSAAFTYSWTNDPNTPAGSSTTINASSANVTVVEPTLTIASQASTDGTAYSSSITGRQAGDTVYYKITISNTTAGSTAAYDLSLLDNLPTVGGHSVLNGVTVDSVTGTGAGNVLLTGSDAAGYSLAFASGAVDLAFNGTITIVVKGTVAYEAQTGQTYNNTATVRWTSLDGDQTNLSTYNSSAAKERTGALGGTTPGTNINFAQSDQTTYVDNYAATSAAATVADLSPTPTKTVDMTSESSTTGSNVAIGEIVRYRIVWQIPQGTSTNVVITDNLPSGMQYLNDGTTTVALISDNAMTTSLSGAGLTSTDPAYNPVTVLSSGNISGGSGNGGDPVFSLGTIINNDTDSANAEYVVIEFNAVVMNVTGNQAIDNNAGGNSTQTKPSNTVTVVTSTSTQTSSAVQVNVVEPDITNVVKTVTTSGPYVAGSTVGYQVTFSNSSATQSTTAFDVVLTDTLPSYLNPASLTVTSATVNGADVSVNATIDNVTGKVTLSLASLAPGSTVVINYSASLVSTVPAGQIVSNTATVTYSSLPGNGTSLTDGGVTSTPGTAGSSTGERTGSGGAGADGSVLNNYSDSATSSITVSTPTLDKEFKDGSISADDTSVSTSTGTNVVVGETVTYDVLVTLTDGVTKGLSITDDIPAGMKLVSYEIITTKGTAAHQSNMLTANYGGSSVATPTDNVGGGLADGADLALSFGDVSVPIGGATAHTNQFVVRLTLVVDNVTANQAGTTLQNKASLSYTNPNNSSTVTVNATGQPSVTVAEPTLTVLKTVNAPQADAGDLLTYTITIGNSSGQTAYDVTLRDVIDDFLVNPYFGATPVVTSGGVTVNGGAMTASDLVIVSSGGHSVLQLGGGRTLNIDSGGQIVITFQASVSSSAITGQDLPNKFEVYWTSTSGTNANERTGADDQNPSAATPQNDSTVLNNYAISSSVVSTAVAPIIVSQEILSTDQANTTGTNVTVGEVITYRVSVRLPEGTTQNLVIDSLLASGTAYVPGSVTVVSQHPDPTSLNDLIDGTTSGTPFGGTVTAPTVTAIGGSSTYGDGTGVRFTFGTDIVNAGDNNADNNVFSFTYQVLVLDAAVNTNGHAVTPSATWVAGQVVAATTSALGGGATYNAAGGTGGTGAFSFTTSPTSIDGRTLATGDLVLVKDQADSKQNGVYKVLADGTWERWVNYDQNNEILTTTRIEVTGGNTNAGKSYSVTSAVNVNVTAITFSQVASNAVLIDTNSVSNPNANGITATVVLPNLTIAKTVQVNGSGTSGDAGDPVQYTITISHSGTSTSNAYDLNLTDTIPNQISTTGLTITSAYITDGVTNTDVTSLLSLSGRSLTTTNGNLDLLLGRQLVVVISGNLVDTLSPGLQGGISNTASVSYTTLDSASTTQQTNLIASASSSATTDQERLTSTSSSVTITVPSTLSLTKSLIAGSTSDANTTGSNLTIGETGSFRLAVTLEQGVTSLVSITDTFPSGLDYVSGSAIINLAAGYSVVGVGSNHTYANGEAILASDLSFSGGVLQFNLKNVTVPAGSGTGTGQFSIDYTAQVKNVAANSAGTALTNSATVKADLNGDGDTADAGETSSPATATVTVVEPHLTLTKTTTTTGTDGGDLVQYTFVITNTNAANSSTAYDIRLSDILDTDLTIPDTTLGSGITVTGATVSTNASSASTLDLTLTSLAPGSSVTIVLNAKVVNTVQAGATVTNSANLTYTSLSGSVTGERTGTDGSGGSPNNYATSASSSSFILATPTIDKKTPTDTTYAVGEIVTYDILVTLPEGVTSTLSVRDFLPTGLVYTGYSLVTTAAASGGLLSSDFNGTVSAPTVTNASNTYTFTFGNTTTTADNVTGNNSFILRVSARVDNVAGNQGAGSPGTATSFSNTADLRYTNATSGTLTTVTDPTPPGPVTVVEPKITVTKSVDDTTPHLGQTLTYTITLTNSGDSTAYDTVFSDALPSGITVTGISSVVTSGGATADVAASYTASNVTGQYDIPVGATVTIVYTAQVSTDPATIGGTFGGADDTKTNTVSVNWSSLNGGNSSSPDSGERYGGSGVNDYSTNASKAVTVVGPDLSITKSDGGASISPNGSVSYTITVRNNGTDAATNVIISDVLPSDATISFDAAASTAGFTVDPSDPTGKTIKINVGTLAAGGQITVTVTVDMAASAGATLESISDTASVTHDDVDPTPSNNSATDITPVVAKPDLVVTKVEQNYALPGNPADAGNALVYAITVTNVGNQDAASVTLTDNFLVNYTNQIPVDNISTTGGGVFNPATNTITWNLGTIAGNNGSVTVYVYANVKNPIPPSYVKVDNKATATYVPNVPGDADPTPANNTNIPESVSLPNLPDFVITKTNSTPTIAFDKPFTYTITVVNVGLQSAENVVVTDTLPDLGVFVSVDGGGVYDPVTRKITWNVPGIFLGSGTMTVTYHVTMIVPMHSTTGGTLTNQVSVNTSGTNTGGFVWTDVNPFDNEASVSNPIFQYAFDGYQNFAKWTPFGEDDNNDWHWGRPVNYHPPMLTVTPMYSGAVDPGATLVVDIYNALGIKVGTQTVVADMGGNWYASFPNTVLYDYPQTVVISEEASAMDKPENAGFNLRTYFSPAINSSHFFYQKPDVNAIFRELPSQVMSSMYEGALHPINFDLNNYSYEFISAQPTAAGY